MIPAIAISLLSYSLFYFLSKKVPSLSKIRPFTDSTVLGIIVFVIIFSTGALSSPFFFLTYFLLFVIALVFGAGVATYLAVLFLLAFLFTPKIDFLHEMIQFISLLAIIPVVLYVSKIQEKKKKAENEIKVLKDEEEILEEEISKLNQNSAQKNA